jgi:hypothetical protein
VPSISGILVYTQVHRLFCCFAHHCPQLQRVTNFIDSPLPMGNWPWVHKNHSVQQTFHSNH